MITKRLGYFKLGEECTDAIDALAQAIQLYEKDIEEYQRGNARLREALSEAVTHIRMLHNGSTCEVIERAERVLKTDDL